jgi:hypothetical protein
MKLLLSAAKASTTQSYRESILPVSGGRLRLAFSSKIARPLETLLETLSWELHARPLGTS